MKALVDRQKDFFNSNATKPTEFRLQQLKTLRNLLKSNEARLVEAIHADYGKGAFDSFLSEFYLIYEEIAIAIANVSEWAATKPAPSNALTTPGHSFIIPEPLGVALVIGPWNYPYQLTLAPAVAAIAAGCTIVLKPSELTVKSSALMAELIGEAFAPKYFAVVEGGIPETTELLAQNFDIIFFTGSVPVGKIVYQAAAKHLTPVVLELGGKSPAIIAPDADLEITVRRLIWAKFLNAGQTCIAPDYVCVHESIALEFLEVLKAELLKASYSLEDDSLVRIINERNASRLVNLIEPSKVVIGGTFDIAERFISPTVMAGCDWQDKSMQEEIFGPILPVLTYKEIDSVIQAIKERAKPLALYLFTRDEALKQRILSEVSFGGGCVNEALMHVTNGHLPFGGVGDSGIGSYHGEAGFRSFSHYKGIVDKDLVADPDLRYLPHTLEKLRVLESLGTA